MFCPKCGKSIDDDSIYCSHCGSAVGRPQAPASMERRETNVYAILGLVFSLIGVMVPIVTIVLSILGYAFSVAGLHVAKRLGGEGRGLAIAGIAVSVVEIIILIAVIILLALLS